MTIVKTQLSSLIGSLFLLISVLAGSAQVLAEPAPEGVPLPLALAWKFQSTESGFSVSTPAVDAQRVYYIAPAPPASPAPGATPRADLPVQPARPRLGTTVTNAILYAVDRETGAQVWKLEIGSAVTGGLVVADGLVYFGAADGSLWAVEAATGHKAWHLTAKAAIRSAPLLTGGVLYFGSDDHLVYAYDLQARAFLWRFETDGPVQSTPGVYEDSVYVASQDGYLYRLRAAAGTIVWRQPLPSRQVYSSPLVTSGRVIVAAGTDVVALDARDGSSYWQFTAGALIVGTPVAAGRLVFVGSYDGVVYALSDRDGRPVWRYPAQGAGPVIASAPLTLGEAVLVRRGPRNVVALAQTDGRLLWEYSLPAPPPITAFGRSMGGLPLPAGGGSGSTGTIGVGRGAGAPSALGGAAGLAGTRSRFGATAVAPELGETVEPVSEQAPGAGSTLPGPRLPGPADSPEGGRPGAAFGVPEQYNPQPATGQAQYAPPNPPPPRRAYSGRRGFGRRGGWGLAARGWPGGGSGTTIVSGRPLIVYDPVTGLPEYDTVVQSAPLSEGGQLFLAGDDGVLYGFTAQGSDSTPPQITTALLQMQTREQIYAFQMQAVPVESVTSPPSPEEVLRLPGTPPLWLRVDVSDSGSGLIPERLQVLLDEKPIPNDQVYYDSEAGQVYWVYDPTEVPVPNLPTGMHQVTIRAADWAGNSAEALVCFYVDNALSAPAVPEPAATAPAGPSGQGGPAGGFPRRN